MAGASAQPLCDDQYPSLIPPRCDRPCGSAGTGGRTSTPSVPVWQGPCPSLPPPPVSASTASSNPRLSEPGARGCTGSQHPHCYGEPLGGVIAQEQVLPAAPAPQGEHELTQSWDTCTAPAPCAGQAWRTGQDS